MYSGRNLHNSAAEIETIRQYRYTVKAVGRDLVRAVKYNNMKFETMTTIDDTRS